MAELEEIYANLPEEPEEAFLILERHFRLECEDFVRRAHQEEDVNVFYVDYIAKVLAAIDELSLEAKFSSEVPLIQDVAYQTYLNFSKDVRHYTTRLEIRHAKRIQGFTVRFDITARKKIHHYIDQVREIVERLEISDDRRERLINRISSLELEVDRDRTRLEAYGNLVIEAAGVLGEATEKLEPVRKLLDSIAKVIWGSKKDEGTQPKLPSPREQKRLDPPTPKTNRSRELDDDIPF